MNHICYPLHLCYPCDLIVNVKVIVKVERRCLSPSPSPPYKTPPGYTHPTHIGNYPYHSLPSEVLRDAPPDSLHLSWYTTPHTVGTSACNGIYIFNNFNPLIKNGSKNRPLIFMTNSSAFQQLDDNTIRNTIKELKNCGASHRQLERLTGIGRGFIQRI